MDVQDRLLRLIDRLYEAPGTQEGWLIFLREVQHALGVPAPHGAFYDELNRRIDVERTLLSITETAPHVVSAPSVSGSAHRGPLTEDDMALLRALSPHVRQAVQLHRRLRAAADTSDELMETIDHLPHAVFVLDAAGAIATQNRAGRRLTAARDGLTQERRELRPSDPRDRAALRALIGQCTRASLERGVEAGDLLLVRRPSGRRPYRVVVAPRLCAPHVGLDACGCLVFVTDPEQAPALLSRDVEALWELTPTEARLVCALVSGDNLATASARMGVRTQTLRKQLQAVFEKTGTHRQSDLVRLVLQSVPPVSRHE